MKEDILATLKEAEKQAIEQLSCNWKPLENPCWRCIGSGYTKIEGSFFTCPECDGKGQEDPLAPKRGRLGLP